MDGVEWETLEEVEAKEIFSTRLDYSTTFVHIASIQVVEMEGLRFAACVHVFFIMSGIVPAKVEIYYYSIKLVPFRRIDNLGVYERNARPCSRDIGRVLIRK